MSDHRGEKAVFHFAGLPGHTVKVDAQCIYDQIENGQLATWQVFWGDDGKINHIVNTDNVAFVEVVPDE